MCLDTNFQVHSYFTTCGGLTLLTSMPKTHAECSLEHGPEQHVVAAGTTKHRHVVTEVLTGCTLWQTCKKTARSLYLLRMAWGPVRNTKPQAQCKTRSTACWQSGAAGGSKARSACHRPRVTGEHLQEVQDEWGKSSPSEETSRSCWGWCWSSEQC